LAIPQLTLFLQGLSEPEEDTYSKRRKKFDKIVSRLRKGSAYYRLKKKLPLTKSVDVKPAVESKRKKRISRPLPKFRICIPKYGYYDFHDIFILKLRTNRGYLKNDDATYFPFCLRCLRYGHDLLSKYKPSGVETLSMPCEPRYKSYLRDETYRERLIYLLHWYAYFHSMDHHCANPQCTNFIHHIYIFRKLRTVKWVNMFYSMLSNGINLVFLCCSCHRERKYETLNVLRDEKHSIKAL